jgi:adenosylcobinamide-phosphate synthase
LACQLLNDRWGNVREAVIGSFAFLHTRVRGDRLIPFRLTAVSFAVAGDFMGAVGCWREEAPTCVRASQGIILASAAVRLV